MKMVIGENEKISEAYDKNKVKLIDFIRKSMTKKRRIEQDKGVRRK